MIRHYHAPNRGNWVLDSPTSPNTARQSAATTAKSLVFPTDRRGTTIANHTGESETMPPTLKTNSQPKAFAATAEAPAAVKIALAVIPACCLAFGLLRSYTGSAPITHVTVPTVSSAAEASATVLYAIVGVVVFFGFACVLGSFRKR